MDASSSSPEVTRQGSLSKYVDTLLPILIHSRLSSSNRHKMTCTLYMYFKLHVIMQINAGDVAKLHPSLNPEAESPKCHL